MSALPARIGAAGALLLVHKAVSSVLNPRSRFTAASL